MALLPKCYSRKFIRAIEQTIRDYEMLQPGDPVLVGVSGGPDSIALLHVLLSLAPTLSLKIGVAHFNHDLRKTESERDADFVVSAAESLALPLFVQTEDVRRFRDKKHLSLEEAARRRRYAFYLATARQNGFRKIALAHHADDNAELVLMFLLRGAGSAGVAGIPPVREIGPQRAKVIRPFIHATKAEILAFLKVRQLHYVTDSTNWDLRHLRNRIRHHLLPLLKDQFNPQVVDALQRLSTIMRSEKKWINALVRDLFAGLVLAEAPGRIVISVAKLTRLDAAAQRQIIRYALEKVFGSLRRITFQHTVAVQRLVNGDFNDKRLHLPGNIRILRQTDRLVITHKHYVGLPKPAFEYEIHRPAVIRIKELNAEIKLSQINRHELPDFRQAGQNVAFFDLNTIKFPLLLRSFKPGDRFRPLGMTGSQKVKDFFINQKVPRSKRARFPVLESQAKIIWVVGQRIDDNFKISVSTQKILKCELILA